MTRLGAVFGHSGTPRADMGLAIVIGLFAALLLHEADKIPPPFFDPLGSAAVPEGVAIILAVLAAIIAARSLVSLPWPAHQPTQGYRSRPDVAIGISLAAVAYVAVMDLEILGFRAATIAFVALASAILGRFRPRVVLIGILVAIAVGIGGAYLFTKVFFIALP